MSTTSAAAAVSPAAKVKVEETTNDGKVSIKNETASSANVDNDPLTSSRMLMAADPVITPAADPAAVITPGARTNIHRIDEHDREDGTKNISNNNQTADTKSPPPTIKKEEEAVNENAGDETNKKVAASKDDNDDNRRTNNSTEGKNNNKDDEMKERNEANPQNQEKPRTKDTTNDTDQQPQTEQTQQQQQQDDNDDSHAWHDMLRRAASFKSQTGESIVSLLMVFLTYGDLYEWMQQQRTRHQAKQLTQEQLDQLRTSAPELYQYIAREEAGLAAAAALATTSTTAASSARGKGEDDNDQEDDKNNNMTTTQQQTGRGRGRKRAASTKYDFQEMYERVKMFKELYGHARVKASVSNSKGDPELALWAKTIRSRYHRGTVDPQEVRMLDELDFAWTLTGAEQAEAEGGSKTPPQSPKRQQQQAKNSNNKVVVKRELTDDMTVDQKVLLVLSSRREQHGKIVPVPKIDVCEEVGYKNVDSKNFREAMRRLKNLGHIDHPDGNVKMVIITEEGLEAHLKLDQEQKVTRTTESPENDGSGPRKRKKRVISHF